MLNPKSPAPLDRLKTGRARGGYTIYQATLPHECVSKKLQQSLTRNEVRCGAFRISPRELACTRYRPRVL